MQIPVTRAIVSPTWTAPPPKRSEPIFFNMPNLPVVTKDPAVRPCYYVKQGAVGSPETARFDHIGDYHGTFYHDFAHLAAALTMTRRFAKLLVARDHRRGIAAQSERLVEGEKIVVWATTPRCAGRPQACEAACVIRDVRLATWIL